MIQLIIFEILAVCIFARHIDFAPVVVITLVVWVIMYMIRAEKRGDI